MTLKTAALTTVFTLAALAAGVAVAAERAPATNTHSGVTVTIPAHAVEVTPGVFSLGNAVDPATGESVEGYAIVHRRGNAAAKLGSAKGKPNRCYGYLAAGAKWKVVEPWLINPANTRGLDGATVAALESAAIDKWEDASDGVVGNAAGANILGVGTVTAAPLSVETSAPDGQNEAFFGPVASPGAIAVTTVWGIFGGPPRNRELVEWDQVYDDVDFDWASDGSASAMDFENIATHELGHTFGLADLYTGECAEETMYGYAAEGETNKRDLATGDIAGISSLY